MSKKRHRGDVKGLGSFFVLFFFRLGIGLTRCVWQSSARCTCYTPSRSDRVRLARAALPGTRARRRRRSGRRRCLSCRSYTHTIGRLRGENLDASVEGAVNEGGAGVGSQPPLPFTSLAADCCCPFCCDDAATVLQWVCLYRQLLTAATEQPETVDLSSLRPAWSDEAERVLWTFNATCCGTPGATGKCIA